MTEIINTPKDIPKDMVIVNEYSAVTQARPNSDSIKTTIPTTIAKMLNLQNGDRIHWKMEVGEDGISVSVKKGRKDD